MSVQGEAESGASDQEALLQNEVKRLSALGKDELKKLLAGNNMGDLPFTPATKKILIKKLAKKIIDFQPDIKDTGSSSNEVKDVKSDQTGGDKTAERQVKSETSSHSGTKSSDPSKTHYVVCIPGSVNTITVENDFKEVLKKMKEHKSEKPRMLSFPNLADAVKFKEKHTAIEVCQGSNIKSQYPQEKAEQEEVAEVKFPSPNTPQLNEFRINLEQGNVSLAKEKILSNPRYLVATGDIPRIVKEGAWYNALHACVMAGQLESAQMIMEMLSDIDFLQCLYKNRKWAEESSDRLIDLYLNTPDKVANKTPLRIASERGYVDIVAFLVGFKSCIRDFSRPDGDKMRAKEDGVTQWPTPEEEAFRIC